MGNAVRLVAGLALVGLGIGLLLDRLDVWDFGAVAATWWPLLLIAIGLVQLATRAAPVWVAAAFLVIGAVLQASRLRWIPGEAGDYVWPAVLIFVGLVLMGGISRRRYHEMHSEDRSPPKVEPVQDAAGRIRQLVFFGGYDAHPRGQPFRGGSATAIFGGLKLDLRGSHLPPEGADLDATALFGGVEVVVPDTWRVELYGTPLLGGLDSKTRMPAPHDAPRLRIRGTAIFGAVEVRNDVIHPPPS